MQNNIIDNPAQNSIEESAEVVSTENNLNNVPAGVSIENASYIENNSLGDVGKNDDILKHNNVDSHEEEYTPKLFSDEYSNQSDETIDENSEETRHEKDELFDRDISEEEDFEIPAFLRKQKF